MVAISAEGQCSAQGRKSAITVKEISRDAMELYGGRHILDALMYIVGSLIM